MISQNVFVFDEELIQEFSTAVEERISLNNKTVEVGIDFSSFENSGLIKYKDKPYKLNGLMVVLPTVLLTYYNVHFCNDAPIEKLIERYNADPKFHLLKKLDKDKDYAMDRSTINVLACLFQSLEDNSFVNDGHVEDDNIAVYTIISDLKSNII